MAILPEFYEKRYITSTDELSSKGNLKWQAWDEARPIERGFTFIQETEDTYVWELS